MFSLKDKVAIVTGASRGIGRACKEALEEYGARVYGFNFSDGNDVSNKEDIRSFLNGLNRLDILINSAGITSSDWDKTIDVNLTSVYNFCELAKEKMDNGGSIINISSINSILGFPNNPSYVVSKHGVNGLTRSLAVDYSIRKIRVNAIAPGYIKTDMTNGSWDNKNQMIKDHTILGRWGYPEDIKGPSVFLASNASSYMTGQIIFVDGGWSSMGLKSE